MLAMQSVALLGYVLFQPHLQQRLAHINCRTRSVTVQEFDSDKFEQYANPPKFDGTELEIVEFPNPILRAENAEIIDFDDKLCALCTEMFAVMYGAKGVGLAAPQVGLNLKLFVYNPEPSVPNEFMRKLGERVVANPKIIEYCQRTDVDIEGCLSSRAECCIGDVRRCSELRVEYQDERGAIKRKRLTGFEARVFQHEFDHVNGVLHIDRQAPADRRKIQPFLDVLIEQHGPGGALDLPAETLANLQPLPLGVRPKGAELFEQVQSVATSAPSKAFGFGGFGGGGAKSKVGKKKKR